MSKDSQTTLFSDSLILQLLPSYLSERKRYTFASLSLFKCTSWFTGVSAREEDEYLNLHFYTCMLKLWNWSYLPQTRVQQVAQLGLQPQTSDSESEGALPTVRLLGIHTPVEQGLETVF